MARQRGIDAQLELVQGFVTEANPVSFPQEVCVDIDNCIIDKDKSIRRRPGIDLEQRWKANSINGSVLTAELVEDTATSTSLWEAVNNSGTLDIVVQQVGTTLQFYAQFGAVSQNLLGELDLTPYALNASDLRTTKVATASGLGNLYVVCKYMEPIKVKYDGENFTAEVITIKIRDLDGLDDGLEIDERPENLTSEHTYNLLNQGWTAENIDKFMSLGLSGGDGFALLAIALLKYSGELSGVFTAPSNADIMHVGLVTNSDGNLEFDATFVREGFTGNTPAPKGHFILDAFNKDYATASGLETLPSKVVDIRPEAVAFHQGRVFYTSPNIAGEVGGVYYSQQLTTEDKDGNCYQEADPSADQINELVDTDGGYLPMPGVGQVYALRELGSGIAVIASNGVWRIAGAEIGSSLSATNISLSKVTKTGALGASSVVEVEGTIFFFGIEGIIQLQANDTGYTATNVTQNSIQEFYVSINAEVRRNAVAVYIPEQRKVYWGYREAFADVTPSKRGYNRFLVLDFDVQGFYKYSIGEDATQPFPEVVGLSLVKPLAEQAAAINVIENDGDIVTELDGSPVTELTSTNTGQITQLKLATLVYSTLDSGYKMTFSTFHSRSFTDWRDFDINGVGMDMTSYIDFAQQAMGAPHVKGTPTWVHTFFKKDSKNLEPGGYYELPPLFYSGSAGVRVSQSVIEVLNRPSSNMRTSQSVMEVVHTATSDFKVSQSAIEVLWEV